MQISKPQAETAYHILTYEFYEIVCKYAYMSRGKNRKTHYRGKPTRWYARLQALKAKADRATFAGAAKLGLGGQFDPFL